MAKSTFFKDFKAFISKGNIVDMAVGVVIGGAFGKIVTSLVNDIIMPPIGKLLGDMNFTELKLVLSEAELDEAGEVVKEAITLNYGTFIQTVIDFLIVAFCIFVMLRAIVKSRQKLEALTKKDEAKEEEAPKEPEVPEDILLLREIRDSLKKEDSDENNEKTEENDGEDEEK